MKLLIVLGNGTRCSQALQNLADLNHCWQLNVFNKSNIKCHFVKETKNTFFKAYTVHELFPTLGCQAVGVENSSRDLVCHV